MIIIFVTECVMEGVALVLRDEEGLKGVCLFGFGSSWFSTQMLLVNKFMYIDPKSRGLTNFFKLVKMAQEYAIINNINISFDFIGKNFHRKAKLLERLGFRTVGQSLYF